MLKAVALTPLVVQPLNRGLWKRGDATLSAEEKGQDLPAPSAEIVLIRVFVQAYLATTSRRRADAFLQHAAGILEDEESVSLLLPIRPSWQHGAVARARRGAVAIFRQVLPALIASLPPR